MHWNQHSGGITIVLLVAVLLLSGIVPATLSLQGAATSSSHPNSTLSSKAGHVPTTTLPPPQDPRTGNQLTSEAESSRVSIPGWGNLSMTQAGGAQGSGAMASALQSLAAGSQSPSVAVPPAPQGPLSPVPAGGEMTPRHSIHSSLIPRTVPTVPQWKQLCGWCLPSPRDSAALAYDPNDGYVVMFGGEEQASGTTLGSPLSDTWTYKGGVWTELFPSPSPPPRAASSFVFDTADSKLVLFGGENLGGSVQSPGPTAVLHDMWAFNKGQWTQLKPTAAPPGRFGAPIVYDSMDGYVFLFGGYNWSSGGMISFYDDLWSYKGGVWTQLAMQGGMSGTPGGTKNEAMVYDPYDGYSFLFDGGGSWYYLAGNWYQVASGGEPPVPGFGCNGNFDMTINGIAYDSMNHYVVYQTLVSNANGQVEVTWEYRSGTWINVTTPSTEPTIQCDTSTTYDTPDGYVLQFGGDNPQTANDTWLFPGPLTATVSANRSSVDVNQNITITANPSGGYPPYAYTWTTPANLGCPSSTSISIVCKPTSATGSPFSISMAVTDSAGTTTSPATTSVKVDSDPQEGAPSTSVPTTDVGTSVTFSATPSGGTGTFTYAWSGLPTGTGCSSANKSSIDCTPSQQTTTYVAVSVKDTNGFSITSSPTLFVVHSSPFVSLAANRTNLDSNEVMLFYANASGGTGVYTYGYRGLPAGCTTQNTSRLQCTPTATGLFNVNVTVTDTGGGKYTSNSQPFNVYPDPAITSHWFPVGGQITYANESLSLEINFTGGIGPYSSCISGPPAWPTGCVSGLGGSNLTIPDYQPFTSAGTYPVKVNLTDSTGKVSTLLFDEYVYYPILVTPPSLLAVHEGVSTNASFSIYNLHGALPVNWWLNDTTRGITPCGPVTASSYGTQRCSFSPAWNGTDKLNLTLMDVLHSRLFVTFTYSVPPPLSSMNLKAATSTKSTTQGGTLPDEVGSSTTFSATWTGGNGAYTCTLAENGSVTLATQASSTPSCTLKYIWAHPAAYTVTLAVTDSLGGTGGSTSQSLFVDVISRTSILTFTPSATTVDAGANDNLTVTYTGGYPNYTFLWNFGNGVTHSTATPWVSYAWAQAGSYTASVTITDSLGVTSSPASVTITVDAPPAAKGIDVSDGPISVTGIGNGGSVAIPVQTNATFNMTVKGGIAPFSYTWTVNGKIVASTRSSSPWTVLRYNWSATGNYDLNVTVTDSEGVSSTLTLTVDIKVDTVGPVSLVLTQLALDEGMWNNASVSWSGGWAPFSLHYLFITPTSRQWLNTTSTTVHMMWNGTGIMTITTTVVDAFGYSAGRNVSFTVNPDMSIPCSPTYTGIPLPGSNLTFSIKCLSGGTGPYTYRWIAGNVIVTTTTGTVGLGFTTDGIYDVSVNVTDAAGITVTSKVVKVVVDQIGALTIKPASSTTDVGLKDNLTLSFSGGLGPFTYHYLITTPTRSLWQNGTSPVLELVVTTPGNTTVMAVVEDAYGHSATQNVTITERADPAAPCAPVYTGVPMPGNVLTFSLGCLSGGTAPFTYVWTLGGVTKPTTSGTVSFIFSQAGTFDVSVNVTDAQGLVADSKVLQLGTDAPGITAVNYHVISVKMGKGVAIVTLNITLVTTDPDGVVAKYRWGVTPALADAQWELVSQEVISFNMSTANATFPLYFQVQDSSGRTSTAYTLSLNVSAILSQSNRGNQPTNGYDTTFVYALLVALVAATVAIVAGLVLLSRRKKTPPASGDSDHQPQDDITREIRSRTDGKWVEENALVQRTSSATGKDHSIVRDRIQMLCDNHQGDQCWLEKQNSGGSTEYRWGGSTASQDPDQGESVRIARINQVADEAFRDSENAGGVTGAELLARGADSGLHPIPDELEWLSCMGDRVQAGKITVASGPDFSSTVWRLKIAREEKPNTFFGDIRVDERSLVGSLDEQVETGTKNVPSGRERAEDEEGGPVS